MISIKNPPNLQPPRTLPKAAGAAQAPFFGTAGKPDMRDEHLSAAAAQESSATFQRAMEDFGSYLLKSFAAKVLGDDAANATISFDVHSVDGEETRAGAEQLGADGVRTYDSYLDSKQHFLARGTVTTADGRKFDFDIDVHNELTVQTADDGSADQPEHAGPQGSSTFQLPDFGFPAYLADLLKLIGVDFKGTLATQDGQVAAVKMRMVHVENHSGGDDTYAAAPSMQRVGAGGAGPLSLAVGQRSSVDMHIGDAAVSVQADNEVDLTRDVFGGIPPADQS
jgi:hypothetical protein